jgi:hypothetical protein
MFYLRSTIATNHRVHTGSSGAEVHPAVRYARSISEVAEGANDSSIQTRGDGAEGTP